MAALKKKDDDMKAMEERYKMYLEKARNVSHRSSSPSRLVVCFSRHLDVTLLLLGDQSTGPQTESSHC